MLDQEQTPEEVLDDLPEVEAEEPELEPEQPEEEGELVITLGDDEPEDEALAEEIDTSAMPEKEARTVHRLREALRVQAKAAKEAQRAAEAAAAKAAALEAAAKPKIEPKPYPKPVDYGYDDALHEAAVRAWTENELAVKAEQQRQQAAQAERVKELQARQKVYLEGRDKLRVSNFDTAEAAVMADLSPEQQAAILEVAGEPAKLVYALGLSPKARAELAAIKSPFAFGAKVKELEKEIKVERKPPPVETRMKGGNGAGATGGSLSAQIAVAEKRAAQSGDYTQVFALKRQLKQATARR
jgi:hypothetical protein